MTRLPRPASRPAALLGLFAALAFAPTLSASGFIRDDAFIVAGNALLRGWRLLPRLLAAGYWEGPSGAAAPVAEYRPVVMLSYFLNRAVFGPAPWGFHLVNALLHGAVAGTLYLALRRSLEERVCLAAAALFAVLPVHVEAVAYLAGRTEVLALLFLLLSWRDLRRDPPLPRRGALWYALALLSKESSVAFPVLVAAADWVDGGLRRPQRRRLQAALWALTAASLALRGLILDRPFHGGYDYFTGVPLWPRLLTVARFWALHYVVPMATGYGLRADYGRPFVPDATLVDAFAWACLGAWAAAAAATAWALRRRKPAGLLGLVFFLPLLPTSHLVIQLDTIGAERFLYAPSIAFCVLAALALARAPRPARAALAALWTAFYAARTLAREPVWLSEGAYARAAVRDNPVSAGARNSLGVWLAGQGRVDEARREFETAVAENPRHAVSYFNLARLDFEQRRQEDARRRLEQAARGGYADADGWILLAVLDERRGRVALAAACYERALAIQPWNALAHYNLGRLDWLAGRRDEARAHFRAYLLYAPEAEDATRVRRLLADGV